MTSNPFEDYLVRQKAATEGDTKPPTTSEEKSSNPFEAYLEKQQGVKDKQLGFMETMRAKVEEKLKPTIEATQEGFGKSALGEIGYLASDIEARVLDRERPVIAKMNQDATFWQDLMSGAGEITGDIPFMALGSMGGAALGGSVGTLIEPGFGTVAGGTVGGSFGAFAFPAFIKAAIEEYKAYQEEGNDITFGAFLQSADRTASKTLNSGLFGSILGMMAKSAPLLEKIPAFKNLFETKYIGQAAETVAKSLVVATGATGLQAATGEEPTSRDFAKNLIYALGFNAAEMSGAQEGRVERAYNRSNMTPEEFLKSKEAKVLKKALEKEGARPQTLEAQEKALEVIRSQEQAQRAQEPAPFKSDAEAGRTVKEGVTEAYKARKAEVKNAYAESQKAVGDTKSTFQELIRRAKNRKAKLSTTESPSPGETKAISRINDVIAMLSDSEGKPKDVAIQKVIKTADSISSTLNYMDTEPDAINILKPLVREMNEAVISAAEEAGIDSSIIKNADKQYADYADKYLNKDIRPFLTREDINPEQLGRRTRSERTVRALRNAMPENEALIGRIESETLERRLGKYRKTPSKIGGEAYQKEIANVEELIGKEKTQRYERNLRISGKLINETPESLIRKMKKPEGIRDVRDALVEAKGKKAWENLAADKVVEIFNKNKVKGDITWESLYKSLNNKTNYAAMEELLESKEDTKRLFDTLEKKARKEGRRKATKAILKKSVGYAGVGATAAVVLKKAINTVFEDEREVGLGY